MFRYMSAVFKYVFIIAYSGAWPGGITVLITSDMRLYFIILSDDVVEVRDGEAFTYKDIIKKTINNDTSENSLTRKLHCN